MKVSNIKQRAFIREEECIGCAKCLSVCPVDAIVGAQKWIHTVIEADCIGCEKCIPICPTDCIDLYPMTKMPESSVIRALYERRQTRLEKVEATQRTQSTIEHRKTYLQTLLEKS